MYDNANNAAQQSWDTTFLMPKIQQQQQWQQQHLFNGPLSGTTWMNRYQKRKTNLDFT